MKRRVVITGMGTVNAVGNNQVESWNSLIQGKNGIGPITLFDASAMKVQIAGEVKNLQPELFLDPREIRKLDRSILFALIAAEEAYQQSRLATADFNHDRFGVFVTSGVGGITTIYEESKKAIEKGGDRVSPHFVTNAIINLIGGHIAIKYQAKGPVLPVVTACSSGTNAIGEAYRYIKDGYLDLAFTGGAEAPLNEIGIGGFSSMRALNTTNDINAASIPFDKRRSGFVMAEGAGVLLLEEYEHAVKRHAPILAEIIGYAANSDAYHITAPDETATGVTKCILQALKDADLTIDQIDYINPHGTSTVYNDRMETLALKNVFKEHARHISIGATKSMTGHALGAIGAIEAIICVQAMQHSIIPPTINYQEKDEDCDLDYTPNVAKQRVIRYCLSNSLGFGGHNATLVFKNPNLE